MASAQIGWRPGRGWAATVALLVALLAGTGAFVRARSYDLWWQIETGERILEERSIPGVDDYSFTSRGTPWKNHSWLSQVALYGFHASLGAMGLWLFKALCAAGVAAAGYGALKRAGAPAGVGLVLLAVSQIGLRSRLGERPETVSLLMAACVGTILLGLASRPRMAPLLILAGLTILWANLHAAALIAPVLSAALLAGAALDRAWRRDDGRMIPGAALGLVISAGCLLVNPYGAGLFVVPLEIDRALAPANLMNPEWLRPPPGLFPLFYIVLLASVAMTALSVLKRRPGALARAGILALVSGLALSSVRHIGIFFALLPVCLDSGAISWPRFLERRTAGAFACLAAVAWMLLVPPTGAAIGIGLEPDRFPVNSADFIAENLTGGRLYNDVAFGGYLIWRFYPDRRVFIDGRNEVHASLLQEISEALDDGRRWRALLERHAIDGAVVRYRSGAVQVRDAVTGAVSTSTFSETRFPKSRWALVHWDDVAMIFVRRTGRFETVASEREYRHLRPEAWMQKIPTLGESPPGPEAIAELRRKLAEDPECRLARSIASGFGIR